VLFCCCCCALLPPLLPLPVLLLSASSSLVSNPGVSAPAAAGFLMCGGVCINNATECCTIRYEIGTKCPGTDKCVTSSEACVVNGTCPGEEAAAGETSGRL